MSKQPKTPKSKSGVRKSKARSRAPALLALANQLKSAQKSNTGLRSKIKELNERLAEADNLEEIVHKRTTELQTHQIELEMQNRELLAAQSALATSRTNYADLYNFAPIGYFSLDTYGLIREINVEGSRQLGISKDRLLNKPFSLFIADSENRNLFYAHQRETFKKQSRQTCNLRLKRIDGSIFYAELQSTAVENVDGKAGQIRTAVIDITERKKAEEEIKRLNQDLQNRIAELETIFKTAPIGLAIAYDATGRHIRGNPANERILGLSPGSELSKDAPIPAKYRALQNGHEVPVDELPMQRAARGETVTGQIMDVARKDGRIVNLHCSATPLLDEQGRPRGAVGAFLDITDLKQAEARVVRHNIILNGIGAIFRAALKSGTEEELGQECLAVAEKLTQSKFGFISEIGPDGLLHDIAISDPGWKACAMYDKTGHRKPPGEFKMHGLYGRIITDGKPFFTNEPASHPDSIGVPEGHPSLSAFLGVPLIKSGKAVGMIAVGNRPGGYSDEDMHLLNNLSTPVVQAFIRKRAEKEIKELNKQLAYSINELQAANREQEAFIYSVSHDLRGPLRSISGFSEILLQNYTDKLDETGKTYLDRVSNGAQKMNDLIDDLLRLSRISRQEINRQEIALSEMAASKIAELREAEPERGVAVDIQKGIRAYADKRLVDVVLSNLLGNAWKFTAKAQKARIEFGMIEQNGKSVYYVKDNGAGFDQEYANKLYAPFHRLHSDEDFAGTGIGLAIVERVIRRHGGEIRAEGKTNEGATFFFTLEPSGKAPPPAK